MPAPEKLSLVVFSGEAIRSLISKAPAHTEELIQACAQLGAKFMACEAGLIAAKLTRRELRADLEISECGLVTFLNDCDPRGQIVFI